MIQIRIKSIKNKFLVIVLNLTIIPLLFGFLVMFLRDMERIKNDTVDNVTSIIRVVSENLVTPLDFGDRNEALQQLSKLDKISYIKGIKVYASDNSLFVKYGDDFPIVNIKSQISKSIFIDDKLFVISEVLHNKSILGTVYVEVSLDFMTKEIQRYLISTGILFILILLIVNLIAYKAQSSFLKPIYFLNNFFKQIARNNDYTLRAKKITSDEFGLLYDGINSMLEQINRRDSEKDNVLKELIESEKYNRTLFELLPVGLIVIKYDGSFVDVNAEFSSIIGYSIKDIFSLNFWQLTVGDFKHVNKTILKQIEERSYFDTVDMEIFSSSGKRIIIKFGGLITNVGDEQLILAYVEDITKQRMAELEILRSQDRYKALIQNGTDIIIILQKDGTIRYCSPSAKSNLGYDYSELVTKNIKDILVQEDYEEVDNLLDNMANKVQEENFIFQVKLVAKDGTHKYFEAVANNLLENPAVNGIVINSRDITERITRELESHKKTKEEIYRSEARFRIISDNVPDVISIMDLNGNFLYITPSVYSMLGCVPEELYGQSMLELIHPDYLEQWKKHCDLVFKTFEHKTGEYLFKNKNKVNIWFFIEVTISLIIDDNSARLVATLRDIDQRKKAEESLKESEERFRFMAETTGDALYRLRYDTMQYDYLSPAIKILTGYTLEEINEIGFDNIMVQVENNTIVKPEIDSFDGIDSNMSKIVMNYLIKSKNGDLKWIEDHASLWKDKEGNIVGSVGILQDITERKKLELQLIEQNKELEKTLENLKQMQNQLVTTEKLASIGQLTAGVAHEINNPLGFVSSNLNRFEEYFTDLLDVYSKWSNLRDELTNKREYGEFLDVISRKEKEVDVEYIAEDFYHLMKNSKDGTDRIKAIVESLRGFSYLGVSGIISTDLNNALDETVVMVWNEIKYKAAVEKEYEDLPQIYCNVGELKQVFVNLLVNASHAIEENGLIKIKTYSNGDWVFVEISDNGCGISSENMNKIFDPFFTTKVVGKGSGLGLWISATIINKHKGEISVRSEVGKGTTFKIKLPINQV